MISERDYFMSFLQEYLVVIYAMLLTPLTWGTVMTFMLIYIFEKNGEKKILKRFFIL